MTEDRILPIQPPRLRPSSTLPLFLTTALAFSAGALQAQSLRGSAASLDLQVRVAEEHDFTFLRTPGEVERFVKAGYLVPVRADRNYELHGVSYPYARSEVRSFLASFAERYRRACGEKLVVTSLTRPLSRQPVNASSRSVHPTGMAVDVRRTNSASCRSWIESSLLSLEKAGVLEATREVRPPHYHIALFPESYVRHAEAEATEARDVPVADETGSQAYRVRRGDSLWTIAQAHGVTVEQLKAQNNLRGSRIYAGQLLKVPVVR
jgi:hypothetical protein